MRPVILCLYDISGNIARPWVEAGYEAVCVDLQAADDEPGITHIQADMLDWVPDKALVERVAFVAAWPPCNDVAVSGSRWMAGKGLGALANAIKLFDKAAFWCEWFEVPYLIENPVSTISTYWRKPDHKFHPCHYSGYHHEDDYTKETWLWTGGGFRMPPPAMPLFVEPDTTRIHHMPPGEERANLRSATPMGFARAVFEYNGI